MTALSKTRTITLGLALSGVCAAIYIATSFTGLQTSVEGLVKGFDGVRESVDRLTAIVVADGKALAVLQSRYDALAARVTLIEAQAK